MVRQTLQVRRVTAHAAGDALSKDNRAGRVNDDLVLNLDMAPTLLEFAGVEVPEAMQGLSLGTLASGPAPSDWREAIYYRYYEFPHGWHDVRPHYGVRTERYKLIHFEGDMDLWELYDLQADPHELTNRYGDDDYKAVQQELHERLRALQRELGDTGAPARALDEMVQAEN